MAKVEPYSKVTERIIDTPNPIEVTPGAAIACTIVAPKGPELARITSDDQFLKTYTLDGTVPRDAHISFINAYYLSFFSELIVARSMNSKATGGLAIYANIIGSGAELASDKLYFKDGVELSRYYSLQLSGELPQTVPTSDAEEANDYSNNYWGFVIDNVIYYGGDLETVLANFVRSKTSEKCDLSSLTAIACDQLIDYASTKSYTAQVLDFIASEINKGDEVIAIVGSRLLKIYADDFTTYTAGYTELPDEEGVLKLTEVKCGDITVVISDPIPLPRKDADDEEGKWTRVLTINSKTPGSVNADEYKVKLGKPRYLTAEASGKTIKSMVFDLTIGEDTYLVSFDRNAVDSSGMNIFIETLNTQDNSFNFDFEVADVENIEKLRWGEDYGPIAFGEGFIDQDSAQSVTYLRSALNVLDDQELYDIRYLAPVGITSVPYIKAYSILGERRLWFAPTDVPYDRTNYKAISAYTNQLLDSYNNYCIGPFDKNVGLCGWTVWIAATTLYYERVMTNRKARMEFAPVYDKDTGIMQYSNPSKLLKKSQREKLLSLPLPVNFVVYDERNDLHYMNDNWTHYSHTDNVAGEEMNVRMHHMISLDVNKIMSNFKAKFNNPRYRRLAYDSINNYFKTQVMTQEVKPDDYLITCDETNNTPEIIKARKMKVRVQVRYYNSVKYIDVINDAYAVGGPAFGESGE